VLLSPTVPGIVRRTIKMLVIARIVNIVMTISMLPIRRASCLFIKVRSRET